MDFSPAPITPLRSVDPLAVLLRQRAALVLIQTHEEHAVIERLRELLREILRPLYSWSITRGLRRLDLPKSRTFLLKRGSSPTGSSGGRSSCPTSLPATGL